MAFKLTLGVAVWLESGPPPVHSGCGLSTSGKAGTEIVSMNALHLVNTKNRGRSKNRTYIVLAWAKHRGDPVMRQDKSMSTIKQFVYPPGTYNLVGL